MNEDLLPVGPYLLRMRRTIAHIEANLDDELDLATLSDVAGVSPFHFHRQFSAIFGIGVGRFTRLLRLKRASMQLLARKRRVLDVALANGYGSHEAFSRAFKAEVGQTPSEFRASPDWEQWHEVFEEPLNLVRRKTMTCSYDVTIEHFPETAIAELVHVGPQHLVMRSVQKFIEWRKAAGFSPATTRTFNLIYDDAQEVPPSEYRFGLAVSRGGKRVGENPQGVVESTISAGQVAMVEHVGPDAEMFSVVEAVYRDWLPASGEQLRDAPLLIERLDVGPDVSEHDARCRIYLPLE